MLDVLEPLEVADRHSSSVAKDVGEEAHSLLEQDLLSLAGSRAIRSLYDQFAVEPISIVDVDRLLEGSWDEDVTALKDRYHWL